MRIPPHVPSHLVFEFDFYALGKQLEDPIEFWQDLDRRGAPKIFFTPLHGGHWVFRAYDDVREVYRNWKQFSSFRKTVPLTDSYPLLLPQGVDPPRHQAFRSLLNPVFAPESIRKLEPKIRATAKVLIADFVTDGRCDFVKDFAEKLPTTIFMELMGLPKEHLPQFLQWEFDFFRSTPEAAQAVFGVIWSYLDDFLKRKRASGVFGDDLISTLLRARDADGEPFAQQDLVSCAFLLFLAGLDTVTATMSFIWRYLATDAAARRHIAAHRDDLDAIVDELLRVNAVAILSRRVQFDSEYKGVGLRKDDLVMIPNCLANRDEQVFDSPRQVDFERKNNPHMSFGAGIHRCAGAHLAKAEIRIAIEEWIAAIPEFAIDPTADIHGLAGHVLGFPSLPLVWTSSDQAAS